MFILKNVPGVSDMEDHHRIFCELRRWLVDRFGIREDEVTEDLAFSDLGADSLDIVELVMVIEHKYNIKVSDNAIAGTTNLGQAIQMINQLK